MKYKLTAKQRNPFVALAYKRKAGSHTKSHKALRGKMNRVCSSEAEASGF